MSEFSFYWYDYETWGADPRRDRPCQFAGVRTDAQLNPVGDPLMLYCSPPEDMLPHPEASLVTGLTPQAVASRGTCEAEFIGRIHDELSRPGTCGVGYNTIRFDDEVTRFTLYRNLYDPYAREWQNGNSRWDLIDVVRLTHALRPEGIEWPRRDDGSPSFRLEDLTAANRIAHQGAHDALSDVYATIALAKLIRQRQPRLYEFAFSNRGKQAAAGWLNLADQPVVLHVSGMFPAEQGCISMVVAVARHPTNTNSIIVYDLRFDPDPLLSLDVDEIHQRLFTRADELEQGVERIPLKTVHLNKCPVLAPLKTLNADAVKRWRLDVDTCLARAERIRRAKGLADKVRQVHLVSQFEAESDPDLALYSGPFFSPADRRHMDEIHRASPIDLAAFAGVFDDLRLPEMLFRYRARNWPETLDTEERNHWQIHLEDSLRHGSGGTSLNLAVYFERLDALEAEHRNDAPRVELLHQLRLWGQELQARAGLEAT